MQNRPVWFARGSARVSPRRGARAGRPLCSAFCRTASVRSVERVASDTSDGFESSRLNSRRQPAGGSGQNARGPQNKETKLDDFA